jgi:integrase
MSIMLYLGVRRSVAVSIGRSHESRDGLSVTFGQLKGRKRTAKVLTLPILPRLRTILEASELREECCLEKGYSVPYSAAGFGNSFKECCVEVGLPQCNCHGFGRIGAVRATEAGASEHELMAMFGWENANMARAYRLVEDGLAELDDLLKERIASFKAERERAVSALDHSSKSDGGEAANAARNRVPGSHREGSQLARK